MKESRDDSQVTSRETGEAYRRLLWLLPIPLAALAIQLYVVAGSDWSARLAPLFVYPLFAAVFWWIGNLVLVMASLVLAWRIWLASRYRPVSGCSDDELPTAAVVVPAFNEGEQVYRTLLGLAASDYPAERLEIIAVDDGSEDDTWHWVQRAAQEFPGRIRAIRCRQNRGKKHALLEGFRRSRGEILITVDSDSEVRADSLRNLVSPFRDARVGAVAGNIRNLNLRGLLPHMMDVVWAESELTRAAQSQVGAVVCTPGALSAYRRTATEPVLDAWRDQRFLGRAARLAEDRALTNLLLRAGHVVTFQGNAIAYTTAPERFGKLARMLLRWNRGDVRENAAIFAFVFKRFRRGARLGARFTLVHNALNDFLSWLLWIPATYLVVAASISGTTGLSLSMVIYGTALASGVRFFSFVILRGWRGSAWAFIYGLYHPLALSWIGTYALFTPHNNRWLTRPHRYPVLLPVPTLAPERGGAAPVVSTGPGKLAKPAAVRRPELAA